MEAGSAQAREGAIQSRMPSGQLGFLEHSLVRREQGVKKASGVFTPSAGRLRAAIILRNSYS